MLRSVVWVSTCSNRSLRSSLTGNQMYLNSELSGRNRIDANGTPALALSNGGGEDPNYS